MIRHADAALGGHQVWMILMCVDHSARQELGTPRALGPGIRVEPHPNSANSLCFDAKMSPAEKARLHQNCHQMVLKKRANY